MNVQGISLSIVDDDNIALMGGASITGYRKLTIDHRLAVLLGSEMISLAVNVAAAYFDLGHHIEAEGDVSYTMSGYTIYSSDAKAKAEITYLATKFSKEKIVEYMELKKSFIESNIWSANPLIQKRYDISLEQLRKILLDAHTKSGDELLTYI